jgi:MFS transporter, DHA1 family, multidrug resistance protein
MLGYLRSLGRLPKAVHFYLLSEMLFGIGAGMTIILNFHFLALGFDTTVIGIATACNSIAVAAFSYPAGMVTDRYGAKVAMQIGCGILVLSYLSIGLVSTPIGLYLSQCLLGMGFSFVISCEFPYIMSLCERKEDETTAYNMLIAAFTIALSLGNILGSHLPPHMPKGNTMYQTTIFLVVLSYFLMFIMRFFLPARSERVAAEMRRKPKRTGWKVAPSRQVLLFVLYATINGVIYTLLGPFENVIMRGRFTLSDDSIGYVLAVNSFFLFLVSLFTPYLMQTRFRRFLLYLAFGVLLFVMLMMGMKVSVYAYTLFFLGKGMAGTMINSFVDSSMMKATLEEERGLHSGLRNLMRAVAGSVASTLGGTLLAGGDFHSIYFVTFLAVGVQVVVYSLFVRQQLTKDLEESF